MIKKNKPITKRQLQVLHLVTVDAMLRYDAAYKLGISDVAVDKSLQRTFNKLGVTTTIAAYNKAMELGLLRPKGL